MRRLDLILIKVPYSSRFLGFEKQNKELTKFVSAHLHSLPDPSCDLLLYTSLILYFFSVSGRRLSRCHPKDPPMRSGGLTRRNSLLALAHGVAYSGFPNLNWVQAAILQGNPSLTLWRLRFLKISSRRRKKSVSETRQGLRAATRGSIRALATAHPERSHLGHPASGWLRTGHRTARRYRSTGCGRRTLAAGMGRRRSGRVRLAGRPAEGIHAQQPRMRQTKPPWLPRAHRCPSPWCRRPRPRSLWRPISRCGEPVEPIGQLRLGIRKCLKLLPGC